MDLSFLKLRDNLHVPLIFPDRGLRVISGEQEDIWTLHMQLTRFGLTCFQCLPETALLAW